MRGGATAAQVVIVHRRQVVVHQRVAVHAFECGPGQQRAVMGGTEKAGAFDQQERAHALAAAERRIAHGLEQPRRPGDLVGDRLVRQQPVEQRLGFGGDAGEPCGKVVGTRIHGPHH